MMKPLIFLVCAANEIIGSGDMLDLQRKRTHSFVFAPPDVQALAAVDKQILRRDGRYVTGCAFYSRNDQ
jgi:hypothetical protein